MEFQEFLEFLEFQFQKYSNVKMVKIELTQPVTLTEQALQLQQQKIVRKYPEIKTHRVTPFLLLLIKFFKNELLL